MPETLVDITELTVGVVTAGLGVAVWRGGRPLRRVVAGVLVLAGLAATLNAVGSMISG